MGEACLGNYIEKLVYFLTLAAVFTGLFSSTSILVHGEEVFIGSELEVSDPFLSEYTLSDSEILCSNFPFLKSVEVYSEVISEEDAENKNETKENLTAYVHLFPGTDAKILNSCARIEEWDENSSTAAVCVTPELIEELSSLKGVCSVQQAVSPVIRKIAPEKKESFSSQDFWKRDGITGAGIKIGIISDGVEDISGAIESGALPEDVQILSPGKGTEGTVMLEVVHEISPDAELYFHSAGNNKLEFNRAVDALIAKDCQIICDDVGWPDEPFFEDGIVASHIKEVIEKQDILYVSAAGNDAERHYQGMYFDNGSGWHDFSAGTSNSRNIYMDIPQREKVTVVLQWNDPWDCSANNYDLYFYDCCSGEELASSERVQSGTGTPLEYIQYTNKEKNVKNVSISVKKHCGEDRLLEIYIYAKSAVKIHSDNLVEEDSVFGHPAVPEVICVGAVDSRNPQNIGIASYSSRGPVSIYYPDYELRNKIDLSGPGNVRVSGINGKGSFFAGTSASAPSVAGIGALVWSMYPEKSGTEIREILCSSAEDLGNPGYDTVFGNGSVNSSTISLIENIYIDNKLASEKLGISPSQANGIFSLKISMPLKHIVSMPKLHSGKK